MRDALAKTDQAQWEVFAGDGFASESGRHIHDPTLIHAGGRYFCFSTGHDGFALMRSSLDLQNWTIHQPLLPDRPDWLKQRIPEHRSIWAPDVIRLGGGLRMYYCASLRFGWNTSYIGLAQCTQFDPENPTLGWQDSGLILTSHRGQDHFNAIDPEVIIDQENRHWMFFGSYFSGLYVVELDSVTGRLLRSDQPELILVARNTTDHENAIEGAAVVFHEGYYYLFASYGLAAQGVRSNYRIIVGRSRSVTGPYVDRSGRPMIDGGHTLLLSSSPPMFGPGHCDVMQDQTGRWLLAHHYYDARRFWVGDKWGLPTLQVRDLLWSEDGWPVPGLPVGAAGCRPDASRSDSPVGIWLHQVNFTDPLIVEISQGGALRLGQVSGTWSLTEDVLTIHLPQAAQAGPSEAKVLLAYGGRYYAGRDEADRLVRGIRLES